MSNWLQENIIKNLNAFQLLIVVLAYFILTPFIAVAVALLDGTINPTLEHVFIFLGLCIVVIVFLLVAMIVYKKDKDVKIETSKTVEVTPTEKFTLKQAVALIQSIAGLKATDAYVPVPDTKADLSCVGTDALADELRKRLKKDGTSDSGGSG